MSLERVGNFFLPAIKGWSLTSQWSKDPAWGASPTPDSPEGATEGLRRLGTHRKSWKTLTKGEKLLLLVGKSG